MISLEESTFEPSNDSSFNRSVYELGGMVSTASSEKSLSQAGSSASVLVNVKSLPANSVESAAVS